MLDSLHRRPRGRAVAPILSRLTGGRVPTEPEPPPPPRTQPEAILDALRAYEPPVYADSLGAPSRALLARLDGDDVAEVRRRLTPELDAIYRDATPAMRERLKLILGVHFSVEPVLAKTGLRTDMPPDDVHAMARGPLAAGGDFWMADLIAGALERAGLALADGARVLDFGCSSGRHLRVLQAWRPQVRWMGCDPNAAAVRWAGEHLPGIEFFHSSQEPPLPLDAGALDAAFAVSVWSHFGPEAATRWLEEMRRAIRPGGALVLTAQGIPSLAHYLRIGTIDEPYAVAAVRSLLARGHHWVEAFGAGGDWGVESTQWGTAFMLLDWLTRRTLPGWSTVVYEPARVETNQDLLVLRRN